MEVFLCNLIVSGAIPDAKIHRPSRIVNLRARKANIEQLDQWANCVRKLTDILNKVCYAAFHLPVSCAINAPLSQTSEHSRYLIWFLKKKWFIDKWMMLQQSRSASDCYWCFSSLFYFSGCSSFYEWQSSNLMHGSHEYQFLDARNMMKCWLFWHFCAFIWWLFVKSQEFSWVLMSRNKNFYISSPNNFEIFCCIKLSRTAINICGKRVHLLYKNLYYCYSWLS